jgi:hypothetical protein
MKKIINGAKYDTSTAKKLGEWSNNLGDRDFNNCTERLYRTKSGKYFIYGYGGAMTKYSESCGNNTWSGGSNIEPVSRKAAMEWAEENLDGDGYEEIFGVVPESDDVESLNILIPAELKNKLKLKSEETGDSITNIAIKILTESFDKA